MNPTAFTLQKNNSPSHRGNAKKVPGYELVVYNTNSLLQMRAMPGALSPHNVPANYSAIAGCSITKADHLVERSNHDR